MVAPDKTLDETGYDRFTSDLADLLNTVLDAYYEQHPQSSAFGMDYADPSSTPDGSLFLGRSEGADGADDPLGVDYFVRRHPEEESGRRGSEEAHYIYGDYGWADPNDLVTELPFIRQLFEEAVERGVVGEQVLEAFATAADDYTAWLTAEREKFSLTDLADLFKRHEADHLMTLLGTSEEDSTVVWCLNHSKDEDDELIQNPIDIEMVSEDHQIMMVRAERYYYDDNEGGSWYPYGAVIGYDDTPERFFVHRLESDSDLKNDETDWTPSLVKEKMGFDAHLHEVDPSDLPYKRTIRVQGDLTVTRHDYNKALEDYTDLKQEEIESDLATDWIEDFREDHPEWVEEDGIYLSTRRFSVAIQSTHDDTDSLVELQETLDLSEDVVREKQEARGYARLTAKRRKEIVESLLEQQIIEYAYERADTTPAKVRNKGRKAALERLEDTRSQRNEVIGNHTVILGGTAEYPRSFQRDDRSPADPDTAQAAHVVPDSGSAFIIHDEHDNKQIDFGPGIYEWSFLNGFETEWWM